MKIRLEKKDQKEKKPKVSEKKHRKSEERSGGSGNQRKGPIKENPKSAQ